MTTNDNVELVKNSSLATELSEVQSAVLAKLVITHKLADGEVLLQEGTRGDELYVIVSGSLAVTRETGNGDWVVLHVLRAHDLVGELGFLDDLEHSATVRAIGPTEVFGFKRAQLEGLIDSEPHIVYLIMRAVVREVHGKLRRMNIQHVELSNYISKQHGRY